MLGQVVILNGAPRSGKSSIAKVILDTFDGPWANLGVDVFKERVIPERFSPSIGLRPGGEAPELEPLVVTFYRAMYDSIAAHGRLGVNVVVDVGHHDSYSRPLGILGDCARRLRGLHVLFVGVRCPVEVIMERRRQTWGPDQSSVDSVPDAVQRWQREVHIPGVYDLEVDTSVLSPEVCARLIGQCLREAHGPSAFERLAEVPLPAP